MKIMMFWSAASLHHSHTGCFLPLRSSSKVAFPFSDWIAAPVWIEWNYTEKHWLILTEHNSLSTWDSDTSCILLLQEPHCVHYGCLWMSGNRRGKKTDKTRLRWLVKFQKYRELTVIFFVFLIYFFTCVKMHLHFSYSNALLDRMGSFDNVFIVQWIFLW